MKVPTRIITAALASGVMLFGIGGQAAAGQAMAGEGHRDHHARHWDGGDRFQKMAKALNLSVEQQAAIEGIAKTERPQARELRQQLRGQRRALMEETSQDYDEAKVRPQAQSIGDLVAELTVVTTRMGAKMHAVLTPEQQAQLKSERQARREKRGHKRD